MVAAVQSVRLIYVLLHTRNTAPANVQTHPRPLHLHLPRPCYNTLPDPPLLEFRRVGNKRVFIKLYMYICVYVYTKYVSSLVGI